MFRLIGTVGHALAFALLGALVGYGAVFAYDQLLRPPGWLFAHYAIGTVGGLLVGFAIGWLRGGERVVPSDRAEA